MDVGDGVSGPGVGGFGVDRLVAQGFGAGIVAALLVAEGGHAEDGVPAFIAVPVGAHRLHRPVAQVELAAGEEAADMAVLQREHVERIFLRDTTEDRRAFVEASLRPRHGASEVFAFAVVHSRRSGSVQAARDSAANILSVI